MELSSVLLPGLPPGLNTCTSAPRVECYLKVELQWLLFIQHLSIAYTLYVPFFFVAKPYIYIPVGSNYKPNSCFLDPFRLMIPLVCVCEDLVNMPELH